MILTATGAALAVTAMLPTLASGQNLVNDLLGGLGIGGGASPTAGVPAPTGTGYQPPLHGTNPHGQGSVATVDLLPSNSNPYPADPANGDEEIVIGDSRGEQNGSAYHGKITLLHLGLPAPLDGFNTDLVGADTGPGQTNNGPLGPLNTTLAQLCANSGGAVCLSVLAMNSSTTSTGSTNAYQTLGAGLLGGVVGAGVASSGGDVSEGNGCQTATGSSSVANANVGPINASVLGASSSSQSCSNGSKSTTNSSNIVNLQNGAVAIPSPGCGNGTPNTVFTLAPIPADIISFVCNADDANGGQTSSPYGVREALTGFILLSNTTALIKATLAGPESHAVAPAAPAGPGAGNPAGTNGGGNQGTKGETCAGNEGGAGSAASGAQPGGGSLAFTGQNLLLLGLIGAALISVGLLTNAARQRRVV